MVVQDFSRPDVGDIAMCFFPYTDNPGKPGPQAHPCIIMGVEEKPDGRVFVTVCCATSNLSHFEPHDFEITRRNQVEFFASGLRKDTKFNLTKTATVAYDKTWFLCAETSRFKGTPVIGAMVKSCYERYHRARRAAQSLKDSKR